MASPIVGGPDLSKREMEIAECIAWGAAKKEVADRLSISTRTVENHVRNIFEKLRIQKATELSAWWFCTRFHIPFTESPLKKQIIGVFLFGLVISTFFTEDQPVRVFRTRTRTEARAGRRSRRDEGDTFEL